MKILFDPIYTSKVSSCASAVKFYHLCKSILENTDDYIYWCIPEGLSEEELEWLPKSDRILYISVAQSKDRYTEYRRVTEQMELVFAQQGDYWDWDICVTNRSCAVATISAICNRPTAKTLKPILLMEDFPQMTFKSSTNIPQNEHQDKLAILGYLTATKTMIAAYWERKEIINTAKAYVTASQIKVLRDNIVECHPAALTPMLGTKSDEFINAPKSSPFTIVFAGRLIVGHHFDKIFNIMQNNWILKSRDREIRPVVCTQSRGSSPWLEVPDFIKIHHFKRDDFWSFMRNDANVGVFFSEEEDFSMSLMEPLLLGVPYAVYEAPWSVASLGEDYPFFFKTEMECYAIVKMFFDNYQKAYAVFKEWHDGTLTNLVIERDKVTVQTEYTKVRDEHLINMGTIPAPTSDTSVVNLMYEELEQTPLTFFELATKVSKKNPFTSLLDKLAFKNEMGIRTSFATDKYRWKQQLLCLGAVEGLDVGTYKLADKK